MDKVLTFRHEHFDPELITLIPGEAGGIPPSVGGHRLWAMYNELSRENRLPLRALQLAENPSDTLEDYMITSSDRRPDIITLYHPVHTDNISGLTLYERNNFLTRKKFYDRTIQVNGRDEYAGLYLSDMESPLFIRCSGQLEGMNDTKKAIIVFSTENSKENETTYYQSVDLTESWNIDENGKVGFDFTIALNNDMEADRVKVYLWNKKKMEQKGEIKIEVYEIL